MMKIDHVERSLDIDQDPERHPSTTKRSPEIIQNRHRLPHKTSIKSGTRMIIRKAMINLIHDLFILEIVKVLVEINPIIIQMWSGAAAKNANAITEKVEPKIDHGTEIVRNMIGTVLREVTIKLPNIETAQEIENGKFLVGNIIEFVTISELSFFFYFRTIEINEQI